MVVGNGGREHALLWKLAQSRHVGRLYAAPGNAGTCQLAQNVPLSAEDVGGLVTFAARERIDLTIVGPDDALAAGIVDLFDACGLRIFGPTAAAARVEASKAHAKALMSAGGVPTAAFAIFQSREDALAHIERRALPVVVKASGLALGKGVFVCNTRSEAEDAVNVIMAERRFGAAGNEVVVEDYLEGPEVSLHALCDSTEYVLFCAAQDHKPVGDHDEGPNTGGMGAFAPVPWLQPDDVKRLAERVVAPILAQLQTIGTPFRGLLYPGLKLTSTGPKIVEFNARFGDPETQCYLRLLDCDLVELIDACLNGQLARTAVRWQRGYAACVIVASGGYPGRYRKGLPISGLDGADALEDVVIFHAGSALVDGRYVTAGGRVLGITATASTLEHALEKAYNAVEHVQFEGKHFRSDIGRRPHPQRLLIG